MIGSWGIVSLMIDVVCAIISDQNKRLLVCKRLMGKPLAGCWEFPVGKVEVGQDFSLAIKREIIEELACEIDVCMALPEVEHHYPEYSIRLWPFICSLNRGRPRALEHAELRWVKLNQCDSLKWAPADIPIWKALSLAG